MTVEQANAVYDVLVTHAGASEDGRDDFVFHQTLRSPDEYRFMGALGFGGKFRNERGRWRVSAYPEDAAQWPAIAGMVGVTNAALDGLRASFVALGEALK